MTDRRNRRIKSQVLEELLMNAVEEGKLMIAMPKIANTVIIRGVNLEEVISFELQLPYEVSPEFTGKSIAPQAM